jgi:hypothetical protein
MACVVRQSHCEARQRTCAVLSLDFDGQRLTFQVSLVIVRRWDMLTVDEALCFWIGGSNTGRNISIAWLLSLVKQASKPGKFSVN